MKIAKIALVTTIALFMAGIAYAGSDQPAATTSPDAGRSIKDILFGWTEIPGSIVQVTKDSRNPLWGLTVGTLKGIGRAFSRTIPAVSEATSAPQTDAGKQPAAANDGDGLK